MYSLPLRPNSLNFMLTCSNPPRHSWYKAQMASVTSPWSPLFTAMPVSCCATSYEISLPRVVITGSPYFIISFMRFRAPVKVSIQGLSTFIPQEALLYIKGISAVSTHPKKTKRFLKGDSSISFLNFANVLLSSPSISPPVETKYNLSQTFIASSTPLNKFHSSAHVLYPPIQRRIKL